MHDGGGGRRRDKGDSCTIWPDVARSGELNKLGERVTVAEKMLKS